MAAGTNFPTALDGTETGNSNTLSLESLNAAVHALQKKVGIDSSAVTTTLDYIAAHTQAQGADTIAACTDAAIATPATAQVLRYSSTDSKWHNLALAHADLGSVTADQHHAQAHHAAHEVGGADAVAITHAQTTGRTANDHHAQLHAAAHAPGGGDPLAGSFSVQDLIVTAPTTATCPAGASTPIVWDSTTPMHLTGTDVQLHGADKSLIDIATTGVYAASATLWVQYALLPTNSFQGQLLGGSVGSNASGYATLDATSKIAAISLSCTFYLQAGDTIKLTGINNDGVHDATVIVGNIEVVRLK